MDLLSKTHILRTEQGEEYDCGSHGCSGHVDTTLFCSCGFKKKLSEWETDKDRLSTMRCHTEDIVMAQLGITVEFKR